MSSREPSLDPLSTTMISSAGHVWHSREARHASTQSTPFQFTTIADTSGWSGTVALPRRPGLADEALANLPGRVAARLQPHEGGEATTRGGCVAAALVEQREAVVGRRQPRVELESRMLSCGRLVEAAGQGIRVREAAVRAGIARIEGERGGELARRLGALPLLQECASARCVLASPGARLRGGIGGHHVADVIGVALPAIRF